MTQEIWTIGHSTRTIESFLELLEASAIERLSDVRRFPGSKRHPQFNREALQNSLSRLRIGYSHAAALGGRRHERIPESPNNGWRVEAFNAYADWMTTTEFQTSLAELAAIARTQRTALMCSEAVPWRCHRRLIADALTIRGWTVHHIIGPNRLERHTLTDFARVTEAGLTYPAEPLFPSR